MIVSYDTAHVVSGTLLLSSDEMLTQKAPYDHSNGTCVFCLLTLFHDRLMSSLITHTDVVYLYVANAIVVRLLTTIV